MTATAIQPAIQEDVKQAIVQTIHEDVKQPIVQVVQEDVKQTIAQVTHDDVKRAIVSLIKENNVEITALLADISTQIKKKPKSKKKKKQVIKPRETTTVVVEGEGTPITILQGKRIPFSEMPFWKANPHLKPVSFKEQGYGVSIEALKDLQAFFQEPGNEITDEWFEID